MIRARASQGPLRPAGLFLVLIAGLAVVGGCLPPRSTAVPTIGPGPTATDPTATEASPTDPSDPTDAPASPTPTDDATPTSTPVVATASPGPADVACTGNDKNREFFLLAAAAMSWPVYCAVLGDGWFLDGGRYELAGGGRLEVTYRGPADLHLTLVEGSICAADADVESCAPRDSLIGPATFGDRDAEVGRFGNAFVLDADRGATPSWRATGLGLTLDHFRNLGADFILVDG